MDRALKSRAPRRHGTYGIREARPDDLDALLAVEDVFPTDRLGRRNFRHAVRSATTDLIVAEDEAGAAGYALVQRRRNSKVAHLSSIAVGPGAAGRGLGRALLEAAEARARANGCTRLRLEVRTDNGPAQKLYGRAGYRRLETVPDYYEDGAAAWRYEKDLV
ncbi:MAG TPA: GNAT family N-acetyltransferase [Beijerinckiaceae bacterium]